MRCKNCAALLKDDAKFCPSCGTKVEIPETSAAADTVGNSSKCSACGQELKPGAKFCPFCGAKTDAPKEIPVPVTTAKNPVNLKKSDVETETSANNADTPKAPSLDSPIPTAPSLDSPIPTAPVVNTPRPDANANNCPSCGTALKPGAKFCPVCGKNLSAAPSANANPPVPGVPNTNAPAPGFNGNAPYPPTGGSNIPGAPVPAGGPVQTKVKKPINYVPFIIAGAVIVVIIIAIVIISNIANRPPTVNLDDYLTVEYEGYTGYGYAKVSFNEEKFKDDWSNELKFNVKPSDIPYRYGFNSDDPSSYITACIYDEFKADKTDELSNGDKIKVKWTITNTAKENIERYIKCDLQYSEKEFTVAGLEDLKSVDVFDDIEVTFSGKAPNGKASVYNNSKYYIDYKLDKTDGLSNGDKVKVTISSPYGGDLNKYMADSYQSTLKSTEKEYTVSGLSSIVTNVSDIPSDVLAAFKSETEDFIKSNTADEIITLKSSDYVGTIILTPKDSSWYSGYVYVVYKVTVSVTTTNNNKQDVKEYTYYTYSRFDEITLLEDGTASYDTNGRNTYDSFDFENTWTYVYGYKDYATLFDNVVTSNLDSYTYDTDINESSLSSIGTQTSSSVPEESSQPEESSKTEESSKSEESSKTSSEEPLSLKQYFEENSEEIEQFGTQMSNSTVDMSLSLEGDSTVVFTAKLKSQMEVNDTVKKEFETQTNSLKSSYESMIDGLEEETSTKNITLKIKYLNADDSLIYETEFKNE